MRCLVVLDRAARRFAAASLFALVVWPAIPAAATAGEAARIDRYMSQWFEAGRFNGAVLVAREGREIFKKGYGLADVEQNIPNTPRTQFNIHSISKQFTCVLVFQLAAEGKLDLEDKLADLLPGYRRDTGERVTVDQLLKHTAGIPCYINDAHRRAEGKPVYEWGGRYDRDRFVEDYLSDDFLFEPGSDYKYSNTGYYLLALIIEAVTGKSYAQNLQERIFDPLGMKNSGVIKNDITVPGSALGYTKAPGGLVGVPYENPDNLIGAGNLYSTVDDLLTWNLALEKALVLPEKWRNKMFTVYHEAPHEKHAYSLNYFSVPTQTGGELVYTGFSGGGPGFNSDAFRFPDEKLIVVILDNSTQYNHWRMAPDICAILNGQSPPDPKPLLSDALVDAVANDGLDAAMALYQDIRENRRDDYAPGSGERDINAYGYGVLSTGDVDLAVSIFKLNVQLHPESWNVYDSLGEAYLAAGETELSEQNYAIAREKRDSEQTIIRHMRAGDFEAARRAVEAARAQDPDLVLLTGPRVGPFFEELLSSGEHDRALEVCMIWAMADPVGAGPYFSMARVYMEQGDLEAAKGCFRDIIEKHPDGRAAEFARTRLEALEKR